MKKLHMLALAMMLSASATTQAQTSGATGAVAQGVPHTTVPFRVEDPGEKLPDIQWGLDLAWLWDQNVLRGIAFAGKDLIDIIRLSFQTTNTEALNGNLTADQKKALNDRIRIAKYASKATINLNSDQQEGDLTNVSEWYRSTNSATQAERWAELIYLTKKYVEARGLKVTSVSPFNEPDYTAWHQGSKADFLAICKKLREDETYKEEFEGVALCGGNTLNNDKALEWYNYCKAYLDEGNTHQLAGSFDNFVKFYQQVASDGKVGVADELHNTMEAMVASNYGMTKAIWWGTCEHTRSQFMKASRGTRLGYAENRDNWTAAGVYRHPADQHHPNGYIQGFGGTSERQAFPTTFRFAATDHDVFYNGQGPTREYLMALPGGTAYQQGQTNGETLVNIQDGDDIMPPLPTEATTYKIVNRRSGHLLAPAGNNAANNASLQQREAKPNNLAQQWVVTPADAKDYVGDFYYFKFENAKDTKCHMIVDRWTIDNGANVYLNNGSYDINHQWAIEYAGDGWFYIRNRQSAHYLQTEPGTEKQETVTGRNVQQGTFTGNEVQQWRFIPADVTYNAVPPAAPTALTATPQAASVRLSWTAPADTDLRGYIVLRSDDGQKWHTLHTNVPMPEYVDNTVQPATTYYYKVQAVDLSLNRSEACEPITSAATGEQTCIMRIPCDSLLDLSGNGNHTALYGNAAYRKGKNDGQGLTLSGKQFIQLPATIANSDELTLCTWVYWTSISDWQRIFDFGNDTDHYFFLCPRNGYSNKMRLAIKNGGDEETLDYTTLSTNRWVHVAVTFSHEAVTLYINGNAVASSTSIKARPRDFQPIFNYVGRSQFSADPMLRASVDDIRAYNYALSADAIKAIAEGNDPESLADGIATVRSTDNNDTNSDGTKGIFTLDGKRMPTQEMRPGNIYIVDGKKVSRR